MLLLLLLPDPVLEIVAASGFVACDPVPLPPYAGASVFPVFAGVEAAEVPHNQCLHQQHREGCYQGGPRPAGQPASTQAANHLRTGAARSWKDRLWLCCAARREEGVEVEGGRGGGGGGGGREGGREAELYGGGGEEERRQGEAQGHRVVKLGERLFMMLQATVL